MTHRCAFRCCRSKGEEGGFHPSLPKEKSSKTSVSFSFPPRRCGGGGSSKNLILHGRASSPDPCAISFLLYVRRRFCFYSELPMDQIFLSPPLTGTLNWKEQIVQPAIFTAVSIDNFAQPCTLFCVLESDCTFIVASFLVDFCSVLISYTSSFLSIRLLKPEHH